MSTPDSTPNPTLSHIYSILHAYLIHNKPVQFFSVSDNKWRDGIPCLDTIKDLSWRIAPTKVTINYRIALMRNKKNNAYWTVSTENTAQEKVIESDEYFDRWITDNNIFIFTPKP